MTPIQSTVRLVLYALIAMISAAMTGIATVDFSDRVQTSLFVLGILSAGLTSVRSYIDKSPSEVKGGDQ